MKKLLLLIALVISVVSFAQTKKKTTVNRKPTAQKTTVLPGLKVFGIGFETTRKKYEQELAKKGYTKPSKFGKYDEFTVEFAGHKNCKFDIYYNVSTDSITNIEIVFPYETYDQASDVHFEIVRQLDTKYGISERKDELSDLYKQLGEYYHGQVENRWNVNGIQILAVLWWNSHSNKKGDNKFYIEYKTNASNSSEIRPNEDL